MVKLNEADIQPLYQQMAKSLAEKIRLGIYPEGSKLPTEEMLSKEYSVSRITVRNALKQLAQDNLIASKQGKGTFVCGKKVERDISVPSSFIQFCADNGYLPRVRIVSTGCRPATKEDADTLQTEPGEQVVVVERVLCMDELPVIYEAFHFRQRYSFLLSENLDNTSILRLLSDKYGFNFKNLHRSIELTFATREVAKLLAVKAGYPLLMIDSHVESVTGKDRSRSIQYVVGDKFKLEF